MNTPFSSVSAAVAVLRARGFALCKPDPREKKPTYKGWSASSLEAGDFAVGDQVGIIGGPLSHGNRPGHALVIVDLDDTKAVEAADAYLPETGMSEGRPGKPRSHRYYLVPFGTIPDWARSSAPDGSAAAERNCGHPGPFKKQFRHRDDGRCVIDFIGTGGQVVCPPATWVSKDGTRKEHREWVGGVPGVAPVVEFIELWQRVCELADVCGARIPAAQPKPPRGRGEHVPVGVTERALKYLAKCEPSVSGQGGHNRLFAAARALVYGFDLHPEQALHMLASEFNPRCSPPWSDAELRHKVENADNVPFGKLRGWLRDDTKPFDRPGRSAAAFAPGPNGAEAAAEVRRKYKFTDSAEFRKADYRVEWFVEYVLARNHPAVLAGPSKGMKTSVLVDLSVSVATGTPFLGKWPVKRRARVAIVSGESGGYALQETFFRVLRSKGLTDDACDGWLKWEFSLPTFADLIDTAAYAEQLADLGCELNMIDPFYLTLGDIDAKNLFEMGRALRAVSELLMVKHGVTPLIAHHANRLLPVGEPMELTHLAYSGLEQFLAQYLFLNRRELYENDGRHELWLTYGGRPGHSGKWVLGIEEGLLGEGLPARKWDVAVTSVCESRHVEGQDRRLAAGKKKFTEHTQDEAAVLDVIDAEANKGLPGASVSWIDGRCVISRDRIKAAIDRLLEAGALTKAPEFKKRSGNGAMVTVKEGYGRPAQG